MPPKPVTALLKLSLPLPTHFVKIDVPEAAQVKVADPPALTFLALVSNEIETNGAAEFGKVTEVPQLFELDEELLPILLEELVVDELLVVVG